MDAIRIRRRIGSTTIEIPDLVDFLGRDVEVIVLGERESREQVAERRRQMLRVGARSDHDRRGLRPDPGVAHRGVRAGRPVRLLLDTHVLLWLEPERLRQDVIDAVTDASNDVLLSVASAWEISDQVRTRQARPTGAGRALAPGQARDLGDPVFSRSRSATR